MADSPRDIKLMDSSFMPPRRDMEGDLPGYKPKPRLFKDGEPKSPYVRDRFGMIWHYQPGWMDDMGDVLEPCWEAPPVAKLIVPVGIELDRYAQQVREARPAVEPTPKAAPKVVPAPEPVQVRGRRKAVAA